jgi:hypothetical protein
VPQAVKKVLLEEEEEGRLEEATWFQARLMRNRCSKWLNMLSKDRAARVEARGKVEAALSMPLCNRLRG